MREKEVSALWVQGWQVWAYWQAVWQAHTAGVPVWLRGESNDLAPTHSWKKPVKDLALGELFRRVEKFLYIGEANRRLYARYGVDTAKLHPAPYCVDNDRFDSQAAELLPQRMDIRRSWNIPEDAYCVLFAAKFIDKKRPFDVVKAVRDSRFQKSKRPLHLLFVGSGELGDSLRRECNVVFDADGKSDLSTSVSAEAISQPSATFAGFLNQKEISKAYVAADCLVLPSDHRETWGLVVNEAMASGLPCVVSDACGCGEDLVAPVNPKARYPLGDTNALADALLEIMQVPPAPSLLRDHVSKFSLDVTVNTVADLFYSRDRRVMQSPVPAVLTQ
jgi:glycosyltransferase involved in cell wall biosynthesis